MSMIVNSAAALLMLVMPVLTQAATPLKVGTLALHRIEKLVQLNRIDEAYITNFQNVTTESLKQNQTTDPAFKTVVYQTKANDIDASSKVTMLHNVEGKVLSSAAEAGIDGSSLSWPDKNALELSTSVFHYIEAHSMHDPQLLLFDVGFKDLTIMQETRNEKIVAVIKVTSNQLAQYIEFLVGTDGVIQSWSLK